MSSFEKVSPGILPLLIERLTISNCSNLKNINSWTLNSFWTKSSIREVRSGLIQVNSSNLFFSQNIAANEPEKKDSLHSSKSNYPLTIRCLWDEESHKCQNISHTILWSLHIPQLTLGFPEDKNKNGKIKMYCHRKTHLLYLGWSNSGPTELSAWHKALSQWHWRVAVCKKQERNYINHKHWLMRKH